MYWTAVNYLKFVIPQIEFRTCYRLCLLLKYIILGETVFACEACRRKYRSKTALNRHVRYDCGKSPKFECNVEFCNYKAYQKVHLIRHLYRIHKIATMKNGRVVGVNACELFSSDSSASDVKFT